MFNITTSDILKSGNFAFELDNGYTISIAVGTGTYSTGNMRDGFISAEIAVINPDGEFVDQGSGSGVEGFQSVNQLIEIINRINAIPVEEKV